LQQQRRTIVKNIIILNEGIRIIDPVTPRESVENQVVLRPIGNRVKLGSENGAFSMVQKEVVFINSEEKENGELLLTDSVVRKEIECSVMKESGARKESERSDMKESGARKEMECSEMKDNLARKENDRSEMKDTARKESMDRSVMKDNTAVETGRDRSTCHSPEKKQQDKISLKSIMNEFPESPRNSKLVFKAHRFNTTVVQHISRRPPPGNPIFATTLSATVPLSHIVLSQALKSSTSGISTKKGISTQSHRLVPGGIRTPNFKIRKISAGGSINVRPENLKKVYQF